MKVFISLGVAPKACEYRLFPPLSFSTEGSQILWVTKPLHSEGCHSFFPPWLPSLCSPLYSMNKYSGWAYESSLWRQAYWMLCDSASRRPLWCEHLSCSFLPRLQTLSHAPLPSLRTVLLYNLSQESRTEGPSSSGVSISTSQSRLLLHTAYQLFHSFLYKFLFRGLILPLSLEPDLSAFIILLSVSRTITPFAFPFTT